MASYSRFFNGWFKGSQTGPCGIACRSCPKTYKCFKGKGLFAPVPLWVWGAGVAALAVPLYINQNPDQFVDLYAGSEHSELTESESKHFEELKHKIGLKHPENVKIVKTANIGPTAIGSDTTNGAVIFIPRQLFDVNNPDQYLSIATQSVQFEGEAKDFDSNIRDHFLHEGILFPEQSEVDFIIGHELAHIANNDTRRKMLVGSSVFFGAHVLIKSYNLLTDKVKAPQVKGILKHTSLMYSAIALTIFGFVLYTERNADITSASKLGNANVACRLVEKKMIQNLVSHELGCSKLVDSNGNDWTEWEHPPLSFQLNYLKKLKEEQEVHH